MNMRTLFLVLVFAFTMFAMSTGTPSQADASGPIIARGAQRAAIKSKHILHRENRPLHFYGNTVRRRAARRR